MTTTARVNGGVSVTPELLRKRGVRGEMVRLICRKRAKNPRRKCPTLSENCQKTQFSVWRCSNANRRTT